MRGLRGAHRLFAAAALAAAGLVSACSQAPVATTYPAEVQKKMQSAYHWQWLAEDLTKRVQAQMEADATLTAKPIHVQAQAADTKFNRMFHTFLVTELLNAGVPVSLEPEGANVLAYTTQIVDHRESLWNRPTPGAITGLTAAFMLPAIAVDQGADGAVGALAVGTATAAAIDAGIGGVSWPTDTELIFTATIRDGETIRFRKAETFYIRSKDWTHYEEPPVYVKPADIVY